MPTGYFAALLSFASIFAIYPNEGHSQTMDGCLRTLSANPERVVYTCANGLVIEAETAADLGISVRSSIGQPEAITLSRDAVLIELPPASGPFQILTPHAIASVRGTIYAVDVEATKTSVFVVRGEVAVSPATGSGEVTLTAGYGVEVSPGAPLEAKLWPTEKASRLLARFGR